MPFKNSTLVFAIHDSKTIKYLKPHKIIVQFKDNLRILTKNAAYHEKKQDCFKNLIMMNITIQES